jgi:hypothetical protein
MATHSSSHLSPELLIGAYQCWKTARNALFQSIDKYIATCETLGSLCSQPTFQWAAKHVPLQSAYPAFDEELSAAAERETRLRAANSDLRRSSNQSKIFSPIGGLPFEILESIFLSANRHCTGRGNGHDNSVYPTTLASVCQTWRELAINIPMLWSHIDIIIRRPEISEATINCVRLWTTRSRDAPLYLDIWVKPDLIDMENQFSGDRYATKVVLRKLVPMLQPIASRIHHVEIGLNVRSDFLMESILANVVDLCNAELVCSLDLWFNPESADPDDD